MTLAEVFKDIPKAVCHGNASIDVNEICIDSRKVRPRSLFFALKGSRANGREFVSTAIANGAAAVVMEEFESPMAALNVPVVTLPNPRGCLGEVASKLHGHPSHRLNVIGVTGTNGKTTTAHLIESILKSANRNPAYIGTVGYRWNRQTLEASHTTPEAPELQRMLALMKSQDVTDVVLECSSHGIEQGRLGGLAFDATLFTNLTQDHLDFHGSMEAYGAAKKKLFTELLAQSPKGKRWAIFNVDDATGETWSQEIEASVLTFSTRIESRASVAPVRFTLKPEGIRALIRHGDERFEIRSDLVGLYNFSNMLAAVTAGIALGIPKASIAQGVERLRQIPGRLQRVENQEGIHVFVDYAHTEDALVHVLDALAPLREKRLIVVFGCGGDRDRSKRPKMGRAVSERADLTFITSDNPRTEDPIAIIKEILSGIHPKTRIVDPYLLNSNSTNMACSMAERRAAIEQALRICGRGDILLIAGKGHETTQEIQGKKIPFDDRALAQEWFSRSTQ